MREDLNNWKIKLNDYLKRINVLGYKIEIKLFE